MARRSQLAPGESLITPRRLLDRAALGADQQQQRPASRRHRPRRRDQAASNGRGCHVTTNRGRNQGSSRHANPTRPTRRLAGRRSDRGDAAPAAPGRGEDELAACRAELEQVRARAGTLDSAITNLDAEHTALMRSIEESRARRDRSEGQRQELVAEREQSDEQRRELQERVTASRTKAEQHREAAQAIAIRVESRRSTKESASAALTRVQSQLAYLKKRRSELRAEIEAAAEPLANDEQTLVGKLDERSSVETDLETRARQAKRSTLSSVTQSSSGSRCSVRLTSPRGRGPGAAPAA